MILVIIICLAIALAATICPLMMASEESRREEREEAADAMHRQIREQAMGDDGYCSLGRSSDG